MPVNTAYLNTAAAPTGFSDQSQIAGSIATFVAAATTGALTSGGAFTASGAATVTGAFTSSSTVDLSSSGVYQLLVTSDATDSIGTAANSLIQDGSLSILSVSLTSAVLAFRSGLTVYGWAADFTNT
jgi:hypothetical protein